MERTEALKIATEHVKTLATNSRGYQDGVTFTDKAAAVEKFARFLMEDEPAETVAEVPPGADGHPVGTRLRDKDGDVWTWEHDGQWHLSSGSNVETLAFIRAQYGPLVLMDGA